MGDARRGYGAAYLRARRAVLAGGPPCAYCGRDADTADHVPPLSEFPDRRMWHGVLVPSCAECNRKRGVVLQQRMRQMHAPRVSRSW